MTNHLIKKEHGVVLTRAQAAAVERTLVMYDTDRESFLKSHQRIMEHKGWQTSANAGLNALSQGALRSVLYEGYAPADEAPLPIIIEPQPAEPPALPHTLWTAIRRRFQALPALQPGAD